MIRKRIQQKVLLSALEMIHMKKWMLWTACLLLLQLGVEAQGYRNQTDNRQPMLRRSRMRAREVKFDPNMVKLNVTGLLMKSVGVQYEHRWKRKITLAGGVIYRPMGSWFFARYYDTTQASVGVSQETRFMYSSSRFRSMMLTPEFRYYLGRRAPRGFYLAAFLRARIDRTLFDFHYYEDLVSNTQQQIGLGRLNETMLGGGIMAGFQLITKKHWGIDFWFLGPWVGNQHVSLKSDVNAKNISSLQQTFIGQDMKAWINDREIKWSDKGIDTRLNYLNVGVRFFGINFAYNF